MVEEEDNDARVLWRYLHGEMCCRLFSDHKEAVSKFMVTGKETLMKMLDTSDEAFCLLLLEVKAKQLIRSVDRESAAKFELDRAKNDRMNYQKNHENAEVPSNIEERIKAAEDKIKGLQKKGRKKRKTVAGRESGEGRDADEEQDTELSTVENQKRFAQLWNKIEEARKKEEENGYGWYEEAWQHLKETKGYNKQGGTGEDCGDGSTRSSLTNAELAGVVPGLKQPENQPQLPDLPGHFSEALSLSLAAITPV